MPVLLGSCDRRRFRRSQATYHDTRENPGYPIIRYRLVNPTKMERTPTELSYAHVTHLLSYRSIYMNILFFLRRHRYVRLSLDEDPAILARDTDFHIFRRVTEEVSGETFGDNKIKYRRDGSDVRKFALRRHFGDSQESGRRNDGVAQKLRFSTTLAAFQKEITRVVKFLQYCCER